MCNAAPKSPLEGYTELVYSKGSDTFYEIPHPVRIVSAEEKKALLQESDDMPESEFLDLVGSMTPEQYEFIRKNIEYSLLSVGYVNIPDGYEAKVEDGKIFVIRKEWKPKEGDRVYVARLYADAMSFHPECYGLFEDIDEDLLKDYTSQGAVFQTEREAQEFCNKLNDAIKPILEGQR